MVGADTARSPLGAVYSPEAVRSASFTSSRIALAAVMKEWPAGVGISPFADRVNSVACRWASNSEIFRLTVASGRPRFLLAFERLPASTAWSTIDMASTRSIGQSLRKNERIVLGFGSYRVEKAGLYVRFTEPTRHDPKGTTS